VQDKAKDWLLRNGKTTQTRKPAQSSFGRGRVPPSIR